MVVVCGVRVFVAWLPCLVVSIGGSCMVECGWLAGVTLLSYWKTSTVENTHNHQNKSRNSFFHPFSSIWQPVVDVKQAGFSRCMLSNNYLPTTSIDDFDKKTNCSKITQKQRNEYVVGEPPLHLSSIVVSNWNVRVTPTHRHRYHQQSQTTSELSDHWQQLKTVASGLCTGSSSHDTDMTIVDKFVSVLVKWITN